MEFHYVMKEEYDASSDSLHPFMYHPPQGDSGTEHIVLYLPAGTNDISLKMYQHIIHHELSHRQDRTFFHLYRNYLPSEKEDPKLYELIGVTFREICVDAHALQIQ